MCPQILETVVNLESMEIMHTEDFMSKHFFRQLDGQQRFNWLYERLRGFYVKEVHPRTLEKKDLQRFLKLSGVERQKEGRRGWKELDGSQRAKYAAAWKKVTAPPDYIVAVVDEQFINPSSSHTSRVRSKGVLLTWMLPDDLVKGEPTASLKGEPTASLKELVSHLRGDPKLQSKWKDILLHARTCMQLAGGSDVAVCYEVCPETWELQREVRFHFHAFVKSSGSDLRLRLLAPFAFEGVKPHITTTIGGMPTSANGRASWSGFFYCCIADKIGTLFCEATKAPFKGFLVSPNWILNLVQSKKIEVELARALLVQCVNASRHIRELEAHEVHLEQEAVRKAQQEGMRLLGGTLKAQKKYSEVDAFLQQFDTALHRYKFLVLSGPSKVGKTAFARSLCDPGLTTLEINCASGAEPDLRAYRLSKHGVLLFDEITADQVVSQRKVFQAQSAPVQMGCSATNCHAYDIFVWRKKLVLANNNWEASFQCLSAAGQAWIHANSIVLVVTAPMWQE